jgi:hypothetical protein
VTDDELKAMFDALHRDNAAMREETAAIRTDSAALREEVAAIRADNVQNNAALREEVAAIRADNVQNNAALREEVAAIRADNVQNNAALREETAAIRADIVFIREENAKAHVETRRHFDVALEAARHETRLVAEGVDQTREMLARKSAELDEKIDRSAAETQAMIKFSHVDLDRRMRTLEETVSDLQVRVERLEGSTH